MLEHLAIITHADFTLSQGLHFRYPVLGNGMLLVDLMGGLAGYIESYRLKFSRLRMILGELWLVVRADVHQLHRGPVRDLVELGLLLFDKIPVAVGEAVPEIVPLLLAPAPPSEDDKALLKRINDYYFQAYYNLWHFNLCDATFDHPVGYNYMAFHLDPAYNFVLERCTAQGFNFEFKMGDPPAPVENIASSRPPRRLRKSVTKR